MNISSQKLSALLDALYPELLDRLKNDLAFPTQTTPKKDKLLRHQDLYLPEVSYLIQSTKVRGEFRQCGFNADGSLRHAKGAMPPAMSAGFYGIEATGTTKFNKAQVRPTEDPDADAAYAQFLLEQEARSYLHLFYIPSAVLGRDVDTYGVKAIWDYRAAPHAKTMYMPGVVGTDGEKVSKVNLSAREFDWVKQQERVPSAVLKATRKFWQAMPEDGGQMITTRSTLLSLMDAFDDGLLPSQVTWDVHTLYNGNVVEDVSTLSEFDFIQPKKIVWRQL